MHEAIPVEPVVPVQVCVPTVKTTGSLDTVRPVLASVSVPDRVVVPPKLALVAFTVSVVGSVTDRVPVALAVVS